MSHGVPKWLPKWLAVNPDGIPDELKQLPQWVTWAFEARAEGEQPTKIPYSPRSLPCGWAAGYRYQRARANDPGTWSDFAAAMKGYTEREGLAGIGFEFAADGGLVGVDLDKCRDPHSGELADWAAEVVRRFNTYAEVSPSGTSVKLWCRGKIPGDGKGKKRPFRTGAVEMYGQGRYFAMTGHVLESSPTTIRDAQAEIEWLWQAAFARPTRTGPRSSGSISERARKYIAKMPPAITGQGGHDQTFAVACALVLGFDLSPDQAFPLLAEYSQRCEPPWSEAELRHKLDDADKQPGERGYLRDAQREPSPSQLQDDGSLGPQIRNWVMAGRGEEERYSPMPMASVLETIRGATGDWPRRVGRWLFAHEAENEIAWLDSTAAAFGYLQSKTGIVPWRGGVGYVTQEQVAAELSRTATHYLAIERFPHWPKMDGHYYACTSPKPGDGSALDALLDRFCPSTPIDRDLFEAMFVTPGWGGPDGCRPAFLITSPTGGCGAGKSKNASMVGHFWGGLVDIHAQEDITEIKQRLLSPEGLARRVAILDNVKSLRFSWPELEALITTSTISGKRMFVGEGSRPNTLTWLLTLNGASLSTDVAQRVVPIHIDRPQSAGSWEEETIAFILENRKALLADVAAFFHRPQRFPQRYSRWATWERDVLSRLRDPDEAQRVILQRQEGADVEREEADLLRDHFANQLCGLHYDVENVRVPIPSALACAWWNAANNEKRPAGGITRILKQACDEGRITWLAPNPCKSNGRGFVWSGCNASPAATVAYDIEDRLLAREKGYQRKVWE